MERTHEEIKELIAPYVLGAVGADEVAVIRSHILTCEECMDEAESLSVASASLSVLVDPMELPPGFEDRVIARVRADSARVSGRSRWRLSLAPLLSGAALLVAIVVLAAVLIGSNNRIEDQRSVIAALLQSDSGISLSGDGATARMVPTADGGVFVESGLDAAPDGHIYQVWLMDEACVDQAPACKPVSAGTFEVQDGLGTVETDRSLADFEAVAVTLEEGNGSDHPTTDPVLSSI